MRDTSFLLSPREAAKMLGICEKTLWNWTSPRGDIPRYKLGRLVKYRPKDLEEWLEKKRIGKVITTNTEE